MNKKELVAFAMDYASYIEERVDGIRNIILFGSVARGRFDSESDIDIFIDIPNARKVTEDKVKVLKKNFEKTEKFKRWQIKGLENDINVIIGDLKSTEWESLRASIISDGITLFGKYESVPEDMKGYTIFSYDAVNDERRRINLHRRLFGYSLQGKRYHGVVSDAGGLKMGPRVFMIPLADTDRIRKMLEGMNIKFHVFEVWKND